jgi:hypothetical protein
MGKKQGFDPRIISFQRLKEKGLEHLLRKTLFAQQERKRPCWHSIGMGSDYV